MFTMLWRYGDGNWDGDRYSWDEIRMGQVFRHRGIPRGIPRCRIRGVFSRSHPQFILHYITGRGRGEILCGQLGTGQVIVPVQLSTNRATVSCLPVRRQPSANPIGTTRLANNKVEE